MSEEDHSSTTVIEKALTAMVERKPFVVIRTVAVKYWKPISTIAGALITVGIFYAKFEAVLTQGNTTHTEVALLREQVTVLQVQMTDSKEAQKALAEGQRALAGDLSAMFNAAKITVIPIPPSPEPPKRGSIKRKP